MADMLSTKLTKVHVYSFVPRLAEVLRNKFPSLTICAVSYDENSSHMIQKTVTEKELSELKEANILVTDDHLLCHFYHKLPNLLWAQLSYAGTSRIANAVNKTSVIPHFPVTRCTSLSQQVAEYVIAWIVNYERGFHKLREKQKESIFARDMSKLTFHNTSLKDLTIGIVGVGEIGSTLIGYLKVFNCKVLGYGRSSSAPKDIHLDGYWYGSQLPDFLAECQYVVNILPSTPQTRNFFGGNVLQSAKKKPVFMNVGRGDVISNEDVIKALDNQWISAAILDVFTEEPLPRSSPLWKHPQVIITPHLAGVMSAEDVVSSFQENLDQISSGEPLKYQVDWQKGY